MTDNNPNRIVWAEIPVTDLARAKSFYGAVLTEPLKDDTRGPEPMAMPALCGRPRRCRASLCGQTRTEGNGPDGPSVRAG